MKTLVIARGPRFPFPHHLHPELFVAHSVQGSHACWVGALHAGGEFVAGGGAGEERYLALGGRVGDFGGGEGLEVVVRLLVLRL